LDILTIALCMSIGCAVAWLLALYTDRGVRHLLLDTLFAAAGAALCALAFAGTSPTLSLVGLVTAGPLCSLLMIVIGHAVIRVLR
jgi:hypothetical protein